MKDCEIICTIGPRCEDSDTLKDLKNAGIVLAAETAIGSKPILCA